MLVLRRSEVEDLLDLDALVEAIATAHVRVSAGDASMPPRAAAIAGKIGMLGSMPAYLPSTGLGCKLVSIFPENRDQPTHQAVILLFDSGNGMPLALMDGIYITAMRTAATSALATHLLARPESRVLAVLGTGVQARSHVRALAGIRRWEEVRLAGRDQGRTVALAREFGIEVAPSFEAAVRGADVVVATTHSVEPVVRSDWVAPGTHASSVGYNTMGSELDPSLVRRAKVVVESRSAALAPPPAGAVELVGFSPASVIELGEIVNRTHPGRTSSEEITLYKSVGIAAQDIAAASLVLAAAQRQGVGREIALDNVQY